ncbi:MAG TPA: LPS export ABC transporter periplasmic protein LptC, partial [Alphaproteobacteria bacterium]|nr:LPS export ABC transporter periplasmic protein LptC [Alphaproteobacteria bacterium]
GLAMLSPRYLGTDASGRPFTITAEKAVQDPHDLRRITLQTLQADMTLSDGTWVTLMAEGGLYHQGRQTLQLQGPVSVYSDAGYEFHAGDVAIDFGKGTASSQGAVNGHGPLGELRAEHMRILQGGQHLIFNDNVAVTLRPVRKK